jgi:hypothetical protein
MNAYRVDRRLFRIGDVVSQTGEYLTKLDPERAQVEAYLEKSRPEGKPRRSTVLFVFECRDAAERFWTKEVNGKLYEVDFQGPLLHRDDMNLTDEMFRNRADVSLVRNLAERYWRGEESAFPQIELLIQEAQVVSVVFTTETERRRAFAARAGMPLP